MAADDWRSDLLRTLQEMVATLDASHADVAARIQGVVDELDGAPPGDVSDRVLRRVRRLRQGTMGSLSDVVFAELRDRRWVTDPERTERWKRLSQRLAEAVSRLPPTVPPDLFLVTDRVRECWLGASGLPARPPWPVEVFPPVWLDHDATTEEVVLSPTDSGPVPQRGMDVAVLRAHETDPSAAVLATGRVYADRASAEAALARQKRADA
jgi:hypothetical protein